MSDEEGILCKQPSGRWVICRPGLDPVEIISGDVFRVEVDGELRLTRMEQMWGEDYRLEEAFAAALSQHGTRLSARRERLKPNMTAGPTRVL
jgi:hypothetical protein